MARHDPAAAAAAWATGLQNATTKITAGINAVQVAPGQAAARQKDVWAANVAASKDKWAANTARVSLTDWQQAAVTKGVARIGPGAAAAQGKMAAFLTQLFPHIDRTVASLPARGGLDANIARMVAFSRGMSTFKRGS